MRAILINKNPAISRLVSLSLQKLNITYKEIDSSKDLEECEIIIADNECEIDIKKCQQLSKKFILILGKNETSDEAIIIHKPFLPTDFIDLINSFKDELKSNDFSISEDLDNIDLLNDDLDLDTLGDLDSNLDFNLADYDLDNKENSLDDGLDFNLDEIDLKTSENLEEEFDNNQLDNIDDLDFNLDDELEKNLDDLESNLDEIDLKTSENLEEDFENNQLDNIDDLDFNLDDELEKNLDDLESNLDEIDLKTSENLEEDFENNQLDNIDDLDFNLDDELEKNLDEIDLTTIENLEEEFDNNQLDNIDDLDNGLGEELDFAGNLDDLNNLDDFSMPESFEELSRDYQDLLQDDSPNSKNILDNLESSEVDDKLDDFDLDVDLEMINQEVLSEDSLENNLAKPELEISDNLELEFEDNLEDGMNDLSLDNSFEELEQLSAFEEEKVIEENIVLGEEKVSDFDDLNEMEIKKALGEEIQEELEKDIQENILDIKEEKQNNIEISADEDISEVSENITNAVNQAIVNSTKGTKNRIKDINISINISFKD